MGAEPWFCVVPYQENIEAALHFAQEREFKAGDYRGGEDPKNRPATIEEARLLSEADGTCSILDMLGVIDTPHKVEDGEYLGDDLCMVAPLSPQQLIELYGTEKPTLSQVLKDHDLYNWLDRGIASYVVVYEGDTPKEIYFAGYSFD